MSNERLETLIKMYKENPNDPFICYGIFLEYQNFNTTEAEKFLKILLNDFPQYLPTYYKAAEFYTQTEKYDLAMKCYNDGIDLAKQQQNQHALGELTQAKSFLEEDMEDLDD